jgi:TonB family protein
MFHSSKNILLTICLLVFIFGYSLAADGRQIIGQVLDSESKKPLRNINVSIFGTNLSAITNHLGFFSIEIGADQTELVISSIGYQTSKIEIPQANQFKILLAKEFVMLETLVLGTQNSVMDPNKLLISNQEANLSEVSAKYPGEWVNFYKDLSTILVKDLSYFFQDSIYQVQFSINDEGLPNNIKANNNRITEMVKSAFNGLQKWTPAKQNNVAIEQYYLLPIKRAKPMEEIFTIVENPALPVGGMPKFYKFIGEQIKYPATARQLGIEGKVVIEFIVNRDGSLTDFKIISGIGGGCDEETLRVFSLSPNWIPGKQRGVPVRQKIVTSLTFSLSNANGESSASSNNSIASLYGSLQRAGILETPPQSFSEVSKKSTVISLVGKNLIAIPNNIGEFKNLKELDLENNKIVSIPEEFGELTKLTSFFISRNLIKELPLSFSNLQSLKVLGLAKNDFIEFPPLLTKLRKLEALDLSNNKIKELPVEIIYLNNLKQLHLQNNELKSVPEELFKLKKLKRLHLEGNQLNEETKKRIRTEFPDTEITF